MRSGLSDGGSRTGLASANLHQKDRGFLWLRSVFVKGSPLSGGGAAAQMHILEPTLTFYLQPLILQPKDSLAQPQ